MRLTPLKYKVFSAYLWLITLINLVFVLLTFFMSSFSLSGPERSVMIAQPVPSASTKAAPDYDVDALNPYGQSIARAGLQNCAVAMNDLSERLLAGKKVGTYRFPVSRNDFVSLSMEVATNRGAILYLTFNLSQRPDGSCEIAYEAVSDWANSCKDIVKTIYKDFVPTRNLLKSVALLRHKDNQRRKVFTMPVQSGCIAIEKEIVSIGD